MFWFTRWKSFTNNDIAIRFPCFRPQPVIQSIHGRRYDVPGSSQCPARRRQGQGQGPAYATAQNRPEQSPILDLVERGGRIRQGTCLLPANSAPTGLRKCYRQTRVGAAGSPPAGRKRPAVSVKPSAPVGRKTRPGRRQTQRETNNQEP